MLLNTASKRRHIKVLLTSTVLLMIGAVLFLSLKRDSPEVFQPLLIQHSKVDIPRLTDKKLAVETSNHGDVQQPALSSKKKYGVPVSGVNYTIIYNKVPKCGSRSMDYLLQRQAYRLHVPGEQIVVRYSLEFGEAVRETEEAVLSDIASMAAHTPALYSDHFFYTPIKHKSDSIVYINMIRDPIDQFVSGFYFTRHGDKSVLPYRMNMLKALQKESLEPGRNFDETVDDCVRRRTCEAENEWYNSVLRFFCGSHPKCSTKSEWSLAEAKRRVEEEYLVVGLLEDLAGSVRVMEKLAPSLFNGIVNDYLEANKTFGGKEPEAFRSLQKTPPSADVRAILRQRLDYTYQFYDFVKAKLERLKEDLGID